MRRGRKKKSPSMKESFYKKGRKKPKNRKKNEKMWRRIIPFFKNVWYNKANRYFIVEVEGVNGYRNCGKRATFRRA